MKAKMMKCHKGTWHGHAMCEWDILKGRFGAAKHTK